MTYEGYNGTIEIEDSALVIARSGRIARAAFGKETPQRRIPLQAVHGVRFKAASRLTNGWVQVLLGGEDAPEPTQGTAAGDPNVVTFTHAKHEEFEQLHQWLLGVVQRSRELGIDPRSVSYDPGQSRGERTRKQAQQPELAPEGLERPKAQSASLLRNAAASIILEALANAEPDPNVLFQGVSHDPGRNANVTLYRDRLERVKEARLTSVSRARQDTEVTPVRAVSSVQAKKDGILFTKVTVFASGNNIEFRFGHDEAQRCRAALMQLVLEGGTSNAPVVQTPQPAVADLADQLARFASLRDQGVLTEEEFEAQKRKLLG